MSYLPAEWHKQSLIQLTWPHKDTDWAYMLDEVNDCFLKIAYEVLKRQSLLIVAPDPDSIRDSIDNYGADIQKLVTFQNTMVKIQFVINLVIIICGKLHSPAIKTEIQQQGSSVFFQQGDKSMIACPSIICVDF